MTAKFQDYYQLLDVSRSASAGDIQKAYRALARKLHPDVNKEPGAEQRFKAINEAYEVLKDDQKRALYDRLGENWKHGQEFRPPPGAANGQGRAYRPRAARGAPHGGFSTGDGTDFSEFFESIFGGAAGGGGGAGGFSGFSEDDFASAARGHARGKARSPRSAQPRQGQTHEAQLTLSLADLHRGGTHRVSLSGTGKSGEESRSYDVRIPPGVTDGSVIRLPGQGGPGTSGAPAGDLLLTIRLAPDARFRVDELNKHDLYTLVQISPWEAALGAKVNVPTLEGEITLTIPPGSQSSQKLRIRGRGLPKKSGEPGDLFAELRIVVPRTLSPDERVAFEALARASNFEPRNA